MNYFELHLGDYAEATGHLTMMEDAAYMRLLRKCYATEKPLPADVSAVKRLVGARSQDEMDAVDAVLREFFKLREDGWHNDRVDEEIERFRVKQAKAKASADARWSTSTRQSHQGRSANAVRTHNERIANARETHCEGNALQAPSSKLHTPVKELDPSAAAPATAKKGSRLASTWEPSAEELAWSATNHPTVNAKHEAAKFRDYWLGASGKSASKLDWPATFRNWIRNAEKYTNAGTKQASSDPLGWMDEKVFT